MGNKLHTFEYIETKRTRCVLRLKHLYVVGETQPNYIR